MNLDINSVGLLADHLKKTISDNITVRKTRILSSEETKNVSPILAEVIAISEAKIAIERVADYLLNRLIFANIEQILSSGTEKKPSLLYKINKVWNDFNVKLDAKEEIPDVVDKE